MNKGSIPIIYVAGPYRAATPEGVGLNIASAYKVGTEVIKRGYGVIIPHSNTGCMERILSNVPDEFWLAMTLELMRRCDAVVLCPGWTRSTGTLGEINEARRIGLPVYEDVDDLPEIDAFAESVAA